MGLPSDIQLLNNLATTTLEERLQDIQDNFFTTNALIAKLFHLYGKGLDVLKERGGGVKIVEPILYKNIPSASYDGNDTFDTDKHEFLTALQFNWRRAYTPVNFDAQELAQNAANDEVQFLSLVDATADAAYMSLLDLLGFMIYGTTQNAAGTVISAVVGPKDWDGLYNAIDTSTGTYTTYGGITRSATLGDPGYAINGQVINAASAPLTKAILQQGYNACVFNNSKPDIGLTTRLLYNELWERTEAQDRNPPGPLRDVGFDTIRFNGAEVVADDHILAGNFYWITAPSWRLWLMEGRDMVRRAKLYGFDDRGFPVHNQDKFVDQLIISGNLVCASPRLNAVITSLS